MLDKLGVVPRAAAIWGGVLLLGAPIAYGADLAAQKYISGAVQESIADLEQKTEAQGTQLQAVASSQIRTEVTVQGLQASQAEIKQDLRTVIQLLRQQ